MSRSIKKGPYVSPKLLKKILDARNSGSNKPIKTWERGSMVMPEMVGITFAIHDGRKFLPVLILDKSENFRKIRDHENNTGWIHISQLSKKKAAITIDDDQLIFNKPSIYSKPFAILKKGRLCKIHKCKDKWCKISVEKYKGWVKKDILWGLL